MEPQQLSQELHQGKNSCWFASLVLAAPEVIATAGTLVAHHDENTEPSGSTK
jgi:hypothetical protein